MSIHDLLVIGGVQVAPAEVIKRHRLNLMIHSYLYYWCDDPVWTDDQWQNCANRLVELQEAFPDPIGYYDEDFKDWTGATGMHLSRDSDIVVKALEVVRLMERNRADAYSD